MGHRRAAQTSDRRLLGAECWQASPPSGSLGHFHHVTIILLEPRLAEMLLTSIYFTSSIQLVTKSQKPYTYSPSSLVLLPLPPFWLTPKVTSQLTISMLSASPLASVVASQPHNCHTHLPKWLHNSCCCKMSRGTSLWPDSSLQFKPSLTFLGRSALSSSSFQPAASYSVKTEPAVAEHVQRARLQATQPLPQDPPLLHICSCLGEPFPHMM